MQILTDAERKAEQRNYALAAVVGLVTIIGGGIVVAHNPSSWMNWLVGIAVIVAGAVVEEKFVLRRK